MFGEVNRIDMTTFGRQSTVKRFLLQLFEMIRFLEFVKSMELWTPPNRGVLVADCDKLTARTICYENFGFGKKALSKSSGFDRHIIQQTYLPKNYRCSYI
jgi:hypothetical protein